MNAKSEAIPDVQNLADTRHLAIDKVGIKGIRHPVVVRDKSVGVPLLQLGLPDAYLEQGDHVQQLAACGLDAAGIAAAIRRRVSE